MLTNSLRQATSFFVSLLGFTPVRPRFSWFSDFPPNPFAPKRHFDTSDDLA